MKTGYFQLHLFLENGGEKHIYQNGRPNEFELNNKTNGSPWVRVRKPSEYRVQWTSGSSMMWGEPLNLSSIFTIDENAIRPRRGTSDPLPVSISGDWNWEDPFISDEESVGGLRVTEVNTSNRSVTMETTSGVALREMQSREQLAQRFPSHRDHVRAHQEVINQMAARHMNEMQRREEQRQADRERLEAERTRQRRPWERVRNFFGRD